MKTVFGILLFGILGLSLFTSQSRADLFVELDDEPSYDSCTPYLSMESQRKCLFGEPHASDYLSHYGYYFCRKFKTIENDSLALKVFVRNTRKCLQEQLYMLPNEANCSELEDYAFDSHALCYEAGGFCDLSFSDKWAVIGLVSDSSLASKMDQSVKQLLDIMDRCDSPLDDGDQTASSPRQGRL